MSSAADTSADDVTPAAPTFEELPLERGSILELHSINSDFDGLIVEFLEVDKDTGKFRVEALKGSEDGKIQAGQNMLIKAKGCRRPDLKPLKLRQALAGIVNSFQRNGNAAKTNRPYFSEHEVITTKSLLDKDPCCAPAWLALGLFVHGDKETEMSNVRRACANGYAYTNLMIGEETLHMGRMILAENLREEGHHRTASRMAEKASENNESLLKVCPRLVFQQEHMAGNDNLHISCKMQSKKRHDKELDALKKAIHHYSECLNASKTLRASGELLENDQERAQHALGGSLHALRRMAQILRDGISRGRAASDRASNNTERTENFESTGARLNGLCTDIRSCWNKIVLACTGEDGTSVYMNESHKELGKSLLSNVDKMEYATGILSTIDKLDR
ncbi:MAG: hypothetical protein SGARI_003130, partial [Bacillariaceae sp.]